MTNLRLFSDQSVSYPYRSLDDVQLWLHHLTCVEASPQQNVTIAELKELSIEL